MLTLVAPLSALILFFYKMNGSAKSEQYCQLPEELPKTITVLFAKWDSRLDFKYIKSGE